MLKFLNYLLSKIPFVKDIPVRSVIRRYLIKLLEPEIYSFIQENIKAEKPSQLNDLYYLCVVMKKSKYFMNIIIETQKEIAYLPISKTANSSIKSSFISIKIGFDVHNDKLFNYNKNLKLIENDKFSTIEKKYYFFTFVRNPFDRLYSCYKNKWTQNDPYLDYLINIYLVGYLKEVNSFETFIKKIVKIPDVIADAHFCSCYSSIYEKGYCFMDFIGRFERLEEDFEPIRKKFGLNKLQKLNQSQVHKDEWKKYYTEELADLVYHKYKKDFELWYPNAYQELLDDLKERKSE